MAAARSLAAAAAAGALSASSIDEATFAAALRTHTGGGGAGGGAPDDPDVIIRTSGERRLSNFLLWQASFSELVFVDALWPDFSESHFADALREFAARDRRFGGHGSGE